MQRLENGAHRLGLRLAPDQVKQFCSYLRELVAWNQRVNLTSITEPGEIEETHFLDSLTLSMALPKPIRARGRVCDVGTGAGFPGVPLKVAFPGLALTLIDSVRKRTRFLDELVSILGLDGVEIITGRAEALGHVSELRESFDAVVSRAVAPLRVLLELTLPLCRTGGRAVLQKKGDIREELAQAGRACQELGGRIAEVKPVPADVLEGQRVLVVVEKVYSAGAKYPRRAGIPAKRPL